jgi:uncharacterized membrane protein
MASHDRAALIAAVALGLGGGLRSFAPPAALAGAGRGPLAGPARFIAFGAAAGELVADKLPDMPSRWAPRGLVLRLAFSAMGGNELAGPAGAGLAAASALSSAWVGSRVRTNIANPRIAFAAAIAEDALCYTLVASASRRLTSGT